MAPADRRLLWRQRRRRIVLYPARVVGRVSELGADRGADESRNPDSALGNAVGIFRASGSAALLGNPGVVRRQYRARAGGARSVAGELFRGRLRALGKSDGNLAAANRGEPDATDSVRGRAAQHPVSQPGAGAVLRRGPSAAFYRGRDGCARQWTVSGGNGGATIRRANRAGDAVGGLGSGKYG